MATGNGLYHVTVEVPGGIACGNQGVIVVRDGTLRGASSYLMPMGKC